MNTTTRSRTLRQLATKEVALLAGLLFVGMVIIPIVIYKVGQSVFGVYGGVGFSDFYGTLNSKIRDGDLFAWFLVLSPYLGLLSLRLMAYCWRLTGHQSGSS